MKILVVDDQAEDVGALAQSLHELTNHEVVMAVGSQQALDLARAEGAPDVLITEVVLQDLDGFRLNESLRETQPGLQTIYVTAYDLSEYDAYLDGTPVFYKPVDPRAVAAVLPRAVVLPAPATHDSQAMPAGDALSITDELPPDQRSQSHKLRHLVNKQGFTGKLDQFDLVDIIQLCCVSKRSGRLQIARRSERGVLVHARRSDRPCRRAGRCKARRPPTRSSAGPTGSLLSTTAFSPIPRASRRVGSTSSWKACAAATSRPLSSRKRLRPTPADP